MYLCRRKGFACQKTLQINARLSATPRLANTLIMNKIAIPFLALVALISVGFGYKSAKNSTKPHPVHVSKSLFHNPDSLLYYAALAYKDDDPQGLYVTGAAAFLREQDPNFPDSCTTVSLDVARIMLTRAAELGHEDARTLILCLGL